MLKVINFFAEPSAGKSTTAAGLFFLMKQAGCRVELVTEYAKERTWEKDKVTLANQEALLTEQAQRQRRLIEGNEFCITDSPLPLGLCYTSFYKLKVLPNFETRLLKEFNSYENINFWIKRTRPYRSEGRNEDISQAEKIQIKLREILYAKGINPWTVSSDIDAPWRVFYMLKKLQPKSLGNVVVPFPTFMEVAIPNFKPLF